MADEKKPVIPTYTLNAKNYIEDISGNEAFTEIVFQLVHAKCFPETTSS